MELFGKVHILKKKTPIQYRGSVNEQRTFQINTWKRVDLNDTHINPKSKQGFIYILLRFRELLPQKRWFWTMSWKAGKNYFLNTRRSNGFLSKKLPTFVDSKLCHLFGDRWFLRHSRLHLFELGMLDNMDVLFLYPECSLPLGNAAIKFYFKSIQYMLLLIYISDYVWKKSD